MTRAATFFGKNAAIFLFGIPIFLMEWLVNLQPEGAGIRAFGGWSPFSYLIFFGAGFLLAFDLRYREAMERLRFISLALGLLTTSLMFFIPIDLSRVGGFVEYSLTVFCRSFNSWFWLVTLLGFGSRLLNFNHTILKFAREAALPFLHTSSDSHRHNWFLHCQLGNERYGEIPNAQHLVICGDFGRICPAD